MVTKAIRNAGKVLNLSVIAINKISSKLKVWSSKSRTTHSQTVVHNASIARISRDFHN